MSQQKDIYRVPVLEAYSEPCLQRRWSYLLGLYGQGPENTGDSRSRVIT